jgi:hypothetical protein
VVKKSAWKTVLTAIMETEGTTSAMRVTLDVVSAREAATNDALNARSIQLITRRTSSSSEPGFVPITAQMVNTQILQTLDAIRAILIVRHAKMILHTALAVD